MGKIYLDHNATTNTLAEVRDKVLSILDTPYNASSIHSYGRDARRLIEKSKKDILSALGANQDYDLIFTSSGTEANNLLVKGLSYDHLFLSPIEHISLIEPAKIQNNVTFLEVDNNGLLNLEKLEAALTTTDSGDKKIISVMLANNETGIIQDIKKISKIARKYGALIHTDAVQAFGKIEVNIDDLDVDLMTISSHKIGGMFGAAALIKRKNIDVSPIIHGGKQEMGFRAGTENIPAIIGFAVAANLITNMLEQYRSIEKLRDYIEESILKFVPEAKIYAKDCTRLPNTSCIAMPGATSEVQLINFDLEGFAISAGSACSSGKIDASHVLSAMNSADKLANNAIRVSLGLSNTEVEAAKFVETWKDVYNRISTVKTKEAILN